MKKQHNSRRDFIKQSGLLTTVFVVQQTLPVASPFVRAPFVHPIPADKKLSREYIQSLYKRGNVTTYLKSKNELQYIGMPVGGINCGTVYAGGDGRLWLWDIFNKNQEGIEPKSIEWKFENQPPKKVRSRDGACYVEPSKDIRPLLQEFAIKITMAGKAIIKTLQSQDWDEIKFEATYPVAKVHYVDNSLPVALQLCLYSPFIPLDEDNSNLPATIINFSVKNKSRERIAVSITGVLENKTAINTAKENTHVRINSFQSAAGVNGVSQYVKYANGGEKQDGDNDEGNTTLACLSGSSTVNTTGVWPLVANDFEKTNKQESVASIVDKLLGSVNKTFHLDAGKTTEANFVIAWYFPNVNLTRRFKKLQDDGAYYAVKFKSSFDVVEYIAKNFKYLSGNTMLWQQTWYNESSLPHWFLERAFLNISTLATATAKRFKTGRFWGWEGVGACEGTCTHVWQYAQAVGRIFPALEKSTRENVDLNIAMQENGGIKFRGELETRPAVDGQAGTILRIYREHQLSSDDSFLRKNWANTKRAIEYLFTLDKNNDGMEDTPVENTLDAMWDGEIAWIVGLCIAAMKAGELMALEMNDDTFAARCEKYVDDGRKNMEAQLFNGEYFIHKPDPVKGRSRLGSYNTCHIDQVFGQSWAFQVGMPRVLDKEKTMSALRALWKYNFATDVGPYLKRVGTGRPYALPGEAGMIMNTNPHNEPKPYGENVDWQLGYFHECMSGFEHQVASHMMAEGMIDEALVLTHAIHDRYHAAKRNPFNEIECSDHYARAMASYGTFITACGFEYHGPKGYIKFAPKWNSENFKTAFTAAEGWGTYSQVCNKTKQIHRLAVKYGKINLTDIGLECVNNQTVKKVNVILENQVIPATFTQSGKNVRVKFSKKYSIATNQTLVISLA